MTEEKKIEAVKSTDVKAVDQVKPAEKTPEADPDIIALKKQLSDAEGREKVERDKRIEAEKQREEANTKVVSTQDNAIKSHEIAVNSSLEIANSNVLQVKRDLREAMEAGDLEKQVELQEKLADARWSYKGAEQAKIQFDKWKENQKNVVPTPESKPQYTAGEQAWIDAHPRFNTDDDYYEAVAGADSAARRRGIKPDTQAYYEYVEARLKKLGLEGNEGVAEETDDSGRDETGSVTETVVEKKKPKESVSAPASYSAPTGGNRTANSKTQFRLTPEMQDMAHRMFGPNSSHKLTEAQAEAKYAAHQLNIRERRAAGEKI